MTMTERIDEMASASRWDFSDSTALFINCTLKRSPEKSHTQGLMDLSIAIMEKNGVGVENIRVVDHRIALGVWPDMTEHGWDADDWPPILEKVMAADILVVTTPIWLGEKSSVCTQVIERLYSASSLLNDAGQYAYYGRVGGCLVTGNEDGAKHCSMNVLYSLQLVRLCCNGCKKDFVASPERYVAMVVAAQGGEAPRIHADDRVEPAAGREGDGHDGDGGPGHHGGRDGGDHDHDGEGHDGEGEGDHGGR